MLKTIPSPSAATRARAIEILIAGMTPLLHRINAVCVVIETRGGYSKAEMLEGVRAFRRGDMTHPIGKQIQDALAAAQAAPGK